MTALNFAQSIIQPGDRYDRSTETLWRLDPESGFWMPRDLMSLAIHAVTSGAVSDPGLVKIIGSKPFHEQVANLIGHFLSKSPTERDPGLIQDASGAIFDVNGNDVPPSVNSFLPSRLKCDFDPHAKSDLLDDFLGRYELDQNILDGVLALIANAAFGRFHRVEKYVIVFGAGGTGKSTFLDFLAATFSTSTGDFLPLVKGNNGADRSVLATNDIFLSHEEKFYAYKRSDSEALKAITAGNQVANKLMYRDASPITPTALPILASNVADSFGHVLSDDAVMRRTAILNFDKRIDPKDFNPNMLEDLIADGAREALVARAFRAMQRWTESGSSWDNNFKSQTDLLDSFKSESNVVQTTIDHVGVISGNMSDTNHRMPLIDLISHVQRVSGLSVSPQSCRRMLLECTDSNGDPFTVRKIQNRWCVAIAGRGALNWYGSASILTDQERNADSKTDPRLPF